MRALRFGSLPGRLPMVPGMERREVSARGVLETALKEPLWSFEQMAAALGKRPDTLAKALRQSRMVLPFPTLQLGPRLRLYRPLEVRLWCEEGIRLALPPAMQITASAPPTAAAAESSALPAETAQKAVFGRFARPRRNAAA